MPTGHVSLTQLRTQVRQRADMVSTQFVTDSELNEWINSSHRELYDLLVSKYGDDYFASSTTLTTDGTDAVTLPSDFYKLLGVDVLESGEWRTLRRFSFAERNQMREPSGVLWSTLFRYRVRGSKLWFDRTPSAGLSVKVWYVPRASDLTSDGYSQNGAATVTLSGLQSGDTLTVTATLIADGTTATKAAIAGSDFTIDPSDTVNAARMADVFNSGGEQDMLASWGVAAVPNSDAIIFSDSVFATRTFAYSTNAAARIVIGDGAPTADGVNGWEEYIVVDAAIKALAKEESDTTQLERAKAGLIARIESAAANRDAGMPAGVADVTGLDQGWW